MQFRGVPNLFSKRFCPRADIKTLEFPRKLTSWRRFHAFLRIINAEAGVDSSLTKKLSLRVFAVDNYLSEPAAGREKNDLRLVTAVAYKF